MACKRRLWTIIEGLQKKQNTNYSTTMYNVYAKKPLKNITVKDDGNGVNGKIVSATFICSNYENYLHVCAEYATATLEKCSSFSLSTNFTQEQQ